MTTIKSDFAALGRFLKLHCDEKDLIFAAPANLKLCVIEEKGYRRRPMVGGEEFFFAGVRTSALGTAIFELKPASPQGFTMLETTTEKVEEEMPGLSDMLIELSMEKGSRRPDVKSAIAFLAKQAAAFETQAVAAEKERELQQAAGNYSNNSLFGMF